MHDSELYDLSDDADYAASIQHGPRSMMRSNSLRSTRSKLSTPEGAEIVYLKDNVAIHPTQYAFERISGRLKLINQGSTLFMNTLDFDLLSHISISYSLLYKVALVICSEDYVYGVTFFISVIFGCSDVRIITIDGAEVQYAVLYGCSAAIGFLQYTWIPYKGQSSKEKLSDKDKNLYTIRAVPMSDVSSIRRHTPALGWQYIIVVLSSGLAFPPLYFYSGGIREFLTTIKQQVNLVRSAEDANVFLVNDFQDPLQRTLSSLDLPRAVSIAKSASPLVSASDSPPTGDLKDAGRASFDISRHHNGMQLQKHSDPARDLSIQVLEKFSMVTRFARETTSQLFSEHGVVFSSNGRKKYNQDPNVHSQHLEYNDIEKVPDAGPIASEPLPQEKNPRNQTSECEAATNVGTFEVIYYKEFERLSLVLGKPRQPSLGTEEWATFLDSEGRVLDSLALKRRIFYGGVEHDLRREVWPFLLEYHRYDSTYVERECMVSVKKLEYESIKNQWKTISAQQSRRFAKYRERKSLIEKDVVRTDRSFSFYDGDDNPNVALLRDILLTYSFYNFDLGYCQGMSDLLSPILFVLKDESESFWCFVSLMERLGPNFNRDQSGMHNQLFALSKLVEILDSPLHDYFKQKDCLNYFFCFRWILIQFKREFAYERTMRLWEVLWTHYLSEHMHLYVCVAVLKQHRNKIMEEQMDFDTLLKFINELSGHIDLDATLRDAEALCICAGENAAACIPPGTPPALPIDDSVYPHQEDVS